MCQQNCPLGRTALCYQPGESGFEPEVDRLIERFHEIKTAYVASSCYSIYRGVLRAALKNPRVPVIWRIDRVVVLGLGNLDGEDHNGTRRGYRSEINALMVQLVCFYETFSNLLHWNLIRPGIYISAQDPYFTPVDIAVLGRLGINATMTEGPAAGVSGDGAFIWAADYPDQEELFLRMDQRYYPYTQQRPSVFVGQTFDFWLAQKSGKLLDGNGNIIARHDTSEEDKSDRRLLANVKKQYDILEICTEDCELHDGGNGRNEIPLTFTLYSRKSDGEKEKARACKPVADLATRLGKDGRAARARRRILGRV